MLAEIQRLFPHVFFPEMYLCSEHNYSGVGNIAEVISKGLKFSSS